MLLDLVRYDRYKDVGEAIRDGMRMVLLQNTELLLGREAIYANRLITEAITAE